MSDPSSRSTTGNPGNTPVFRSPALIIAALVLAESVSAFEAGMIFIALPRFGEIFGAPASTTGWSVTAYMLVAATTALVVGLIVAGLAILTVWIFWELGQREPLVDLRVLANRRMALDLIALSVLALGPIGAVQIVTPMILQTPGSLPVGLGMTATVTGLVAGVAALVGFAASPVAGALAGRWGGRTVFLIGAGLFVVSNLMIFVGHKSLSFMIGAFAVGGVATAFAYTGYPKIVIESVPDSVTSVTTGVLSTARQAFSAIGVAIVSVMLSLSTVPGTTAPALSSFHLAIGWFIGCALIVAVICLFIGRPAPKEQEQGSGGVRSGEEGTAAYA